MRLDPYGSVDDESDKFKVLAWCGQKTILINIADDDDQQKISYQYMKLQLTLYLYDEINWIIFITCFT